MIKIFLNFKITYNKFLYIPLKEDLLIPKLEQATESKTLYLTNNS